MNKPLKEQMKRKVIDDRIDTPDFEAMWSRIQSQITANSVNRSEKPKNYWSTFSKKKLITAAVACSFLIAVPVMASVSLNLNWEQLWRGASTMNALTVGFGERLNLRATSNHIPLTLSGVVTDDQSMNVPFQLEMSNVPAYDVMDFGQLELTDESGVTYKVDTQLKKALENDQFIGMFRTENNLRDRSMDYKLRVQDLVFYNYQLIEVEANPINSEKKSFDLSDPDYHRLAITSVIREGRTFTIRYELEVTDSSLTRFDPHLVLVNDGIILEQKYAATLPPSEDGRLVFQSTFEISDEQLRNSALGLSRLVETDRRMGTWDFSFEADGKKASQSIYRNDLDPSIVTNDSVMAFKELVITPLEIRLTYHDKAFDGFNFPKIRYNKAVLHINGQDIEGGSWMLDKENTYLRFESPEWYKDWSKVPMSLTLSEPDIEEKAPVDQLLRLTSPNSVAQKVNTVIQGFPVTFTYYMDNRDLIVESSSPNPNFYGITQSYLLSGKDQLVPQMNPKPPGGNGTNKTIERYRDIPDGDLLLNPFLYAWTDPLKRVDIRISD